MMLSARTENDDPSEYLDGMPGSTVRERVACAAILMAGRWGPAGLRRAAHEMLNEFEVYGYELVKSKHFPVRSERTTIAPHEQEDRPSNGALAT